MGNFLFRNIYKPLLLFFFSFQYLENKIFREFPWSDWDWLYLLINRLSVLLSRADWFIGPLFCHDNKVVHGSLVAKLGEVNVSFVRKTQQIFIRYHYILFIVSTFTRLCGVFFSMHLPLHCLHGGSWFLTEVAEINRIVAYRNDRQTQPSCLSIHRSFSCVPFLNDDSNLLPLLGLLCDMHLI